MVRVLAELDSLTKGTITSDAMAYVVLLRTALLSYSHKEKVGCVLCDFKTDEILSVGFNYHRYLGPMESCAICGTPVNMEGRACKCFGELITSPDVVHAEDMAVSRLTLEQYASAKVAYVTKVPCKECADKLEAYGVRKIVVLKISGLRYNGEPHGRVSGTI